MGKFQFTAFNDLYSAVETARDASSEAFRAHESNYGMAEVLTAPFKRSLEDDVNAFLAEHKTSESVTSTQAEYDQAWKALDNYLGANKPVMTLKPKARGTPDKPEVLLEYSFGDIQAGEDQSKVVRALNIRYDMRDGVSLIEASEQLETEIVPAIGPQDDETYVSATLIGRRVHEGQSEVGPLSAVGSPTFPMSEYEKAVNGINVWADKVGIDRPKAIFSLE